MQKIISDEMYREENMGLSQVNLKDENSNEKSEEEELQENDERIKENGQLLLDKNEKKYKIHLLSIIGEIEGHQVLGSNTKTTKYEHVLPALAKIEDDKSMDGLLVIINTVGGDVESGLAIAEMIAGLSVPTVSLVLGGSHSIGIPLAVSTDYSFIVQSATMMIHPVRINGLVIGVNQTYRQMEKTQERIITFLSEHSKANKERLEALMLDTTQLVNDVGTIMDGPQTVKEGLIDEVGGIKNAFKKLYELIDSRKEECGDKNESEKEKKE